MKNNMKKIVVTFCLSVFMGTIAHAQSKETISLGGYVIGYDENTKLGCFFVDDQMVEMGVATAISNKVNNSCSSPKYGLGATISFKKVPTDSDYNRPPENTLMLYEGHWVVEEGVNKFFVSSFQPFF
jgi:hypothetical protein